MINWRNGNVIKMPRLNRFAEELKRHPDLQNWLAGTIISLGCFSYISWYFITAAQIFAWDKANTFEWLAVILFLIVWGSAYSYELSLGRGMRPQEFPTLR